MGAGESCQNFKLKPNQICEIGKCAINIKGLKSNSASATDIWFVTLQPNTKYDNIVINNKVVLKIYLPSDLKIGKYNNDNEGQLEYESKIYQNIIGPMLEYQINPHFVRFYGNSTDCSFYNMLNILTNKTYDENNPNQLLTEENLRIGLLRNTISMLELYDTESINTISPNLPIIIKSKYSNKENIISRNELEFLFDKRELLRYNIIATEMSNGVLFDDWLQSNSSGLSMLKNNDELQIIIIQLLSALTALKSFKCSHNDLHLKNIFINTQELDEKIYIYNDSIINKDISYTLKSKLSCALYDWDTGYWAELGDNPKLDLNINCKQIMFCNEYIPSRDFLEVFNLLLITLISNDKEKNKDIDINLLNMIFNLIFKSPEAIKYYYNNVFTGPYPQVLKDKNTNKTLSKQWIIDNVRPPDRLLTKFLQLWKETNSLISNMTELSFLSETEKSILYNSNLYNFCDTRIKNIIVQC